MDDTKDIKKLLPRIKLLEEQNNQLKSCKKFGLVFEEKREYLLLPLNDGKYQFNNNIYKYIADINGKVKTKSKKDNTYIINENIYNLIDSELGTYEKESKEYLVKESKLFEYIKQSTKTFKPIFTSKDNGVRNFISDENKPMNYLIEGDNYHSLQLLKSTHYGKVDVIYIDPPYNTGNQDFKYNDKYVDNEDGYRHSKWLTFMKKRLEVSKELLTEDGVIFISIDENENHRLRMLCDDIFGITNFVGQISVVNNLKGRSDGKHFSTCNEYLLVYSNNKSKLKVNQIKIEEEEIDEDYPFQDGTSFYKLTGFRKTGKGWERKERPYMYYPVLKKDNQFYSIKRNEFEKIYNKENKTFNDNYVEELKYKYKELEYEFFLPTNDKGEKGRWRWGFNEKFKSHHKTELETNSKNTLSVKMRATLENGDARGKLSKTVWYKAEYDTGSAGNQLKHIFNRNNNLFDNPKSSLFLKDIFYIFTHKDSIILDFFAGSGTTGQAVQQLNSEDNGNRQYILMTNNENNICEDITYERLSRINNPTKYNLDTKKVKQLPHNLTYLKTEGIDVNSEKGVENIIDMVKLK